MILSKKLLAALCTAALSMPALAETEAYPPMQFFSSVSQEKMLEQLRGTPAFAELDKEALGSPIVLRVRYYKSATAGGSAASLSTIMLSGSTLGLIPVVSNDDLVLNYEVLVHGVPVASYEFTENFTDVDSFWNMDVNALEGPALEWAESTVSLFLEKIAVDAEFKLLIDEYRFYFTDR